jgi:hypothetical protein
MCASDVKSVEIRKNSIRISTGFYGAENVGFRMNRSAELKFP